MSKTSDGPFDNHKLYSSLSVFASANQPKWKKRLLNAGDSFLSLFIVSPLVISFWRGTWGYMDLFPKIYPGMNCMIFGAIIHCCLAILREPLHTKYNSFNSIQTTSVTKFFNFFLFKKMYTYLFGVACIMQW